MGLVYSSYFLGKVECKCCLYLILSVNSIYGAKLIVLCPKCLSISVLQEPSLHKIVKKVLKLVSGCSTAYSSPACFAAFSSSCSAPLATVATLKPALRASFVLV